MSYLHCHNRPCDWTQEDFMTISFSPRLFGPSGRFSPRLLSGFNPISRVFESVGCYWRPRWIGTDEWYVKDMERFGYSYKTRKILVHTSESKRKILDTLGNDEYLKKLPYTQFQVHSWSFLKNELKGIFKNFSSMKWKTYKAFKSDPNKVCPKCGSKNLDID